MKIDSDDAIDRDLLEGASHIARFLFGQDAAARRAYTAVARGIPHFKIGNRIYARKSSLLKWISEQEEQSEN